jgi:hypothetical protein
LFDEHPHALWQSLRFPRQQHAQPITYLLANGGTSEVVDVIESDATGHESSLICWSVKF